LYTKYMHIVHRDTHKSVKIKFTVGVFTKLKLEKLVCAEMYGNTYSHTEW